MNTDPKSASLTRRNVLAGIGTTTAVAGVTAVTATASDIGPNDRRLLELEKQFTAADLPYQDAMEKAADIYLAMPAKLRRMPDKHIFSHCVYGPSLPGTEGGMTAQDLNDKAHWKAKRERYRTGLDIAYRQRCDEIKASRKPAYDACGLTAAEAEETRLYGTCRFS